MRAVHYTKEELWDLSRVSEADVATARDLWIRYSLPLYRSLIDVKVSSSARFTWDAQRRQYKQGGKYISIYDLRNRAIEPFIARIKTVMREISTRLQRKEMTLVQWQRETFDMVKYSQLAVSLIANGGTENNTKADYVKIALIILAMFLFLRTFSEDIESGKQLLNGTLLSRTDLYAEASRDAYEEMERYIHDVYTDDTMERRVLDPEANHCHTVDDWIGCPELAALGWQKIGTLPRLMDTPCLSNCKCHFEYK